MEAWSRDGGSGANGKRRHGGFAARSESERDRDVSHHAGVVKVVEVLAESPYSWEDAARRALEEASVSLRHIRSLYVRDMQAVVEHGRIVAFRLDAKISFEVHSERRTRERQEPSAEQRGAENMNPMQESRRHFRDEGDQERERYDEREGRYGSESRNEGARIRAGGYGPTDQWRDEQPRWQGRSWEQEDYERGGQGMRGGRFGNEERWGGGQGMRGRMSERWSEEPWRGAQGRWQGGSDEWHGGGQYGSRFGGGEYGGGQQYGGSQYGGGQYGGSQYGGGRYGGGQFGRGQFGSGSYGGGQYGGGQYGGGQYGGGRYGGGQYGSQVGQYGGQYGRGQSSQGMGEYEQDRPDLGEQITQFGGAMAGRMRRMFRSPKGYRRSDERIREDVCDQLAQNGQLDPSEIEVSVSNGEVTLSGTVPERYMKWQAEQIIDNVGGVNEIHNQLRVQRGDMSSQQSGTQASSGQGTSGLGISGTTGTTGTTGRNQSRS